MILTPINRDSLPDILEQFERGLADRPLALKAFHRIRASLPPDGDTGDQAAQSAAAIRLAESMGIATLDEDPACAFSWDGHCIRTRSEPSVVIHEIAHWQLCAPERRGLYDFGLGAGPESGRAAEADAVLCLSEAECQDEEALTSLLGILWEVELGQPGLLAFMEQNWLEGYERPTTPEHFDRMLGRLHAAGFVDDEGRPLPVARKPGQVIV